MALTDTAVLQPGTGAVFTGVVGTATKWTVSNLTAFASAGTIPSGWTHLGHTSLEDVLTFGQDGGETEVKGSWQNKALREIQTEAPVDYFVVPSLQFDNDVLALYYGGGDVSVADEFGVPDTATIQEKAVTLVMVDGTSGPIALYAPKASIRREDAMEFDPAEFTTIPLRFTPLKYSTNKKAYWIGDRFGASS